MMGNCMREEQSSLSYQSNQLDHTDPETMLSNLRKNYLPHTSKLIQSFLSFKNKNKQDYMSTEEVSEEIISILRKESIFTARVILAIDYFKIKKQVGMFAKICSADNLVFRRYSKLKGQYQRRYLIDIGLISSRDANGEKNYEFYRDSIQTLHSKQGNYRFLEDKHDYIQWMFPNHYQSMFNSNSYPMGYLEVELFKESRDLGQKMLKSIHIFLDFMGLKLYPNLQFEIVSDKRLRDVLLVNSHNHLRLRRILACLSITGFRPIALRLIQCLKQIVNECAPYERLKRTFLREWQIYGEQNNQNKQQALKLCFHTDDDFPEPHLILKQFLAEARSPRILKNKQIIKIQKRGILSNFSSSSSSSSSVEKKLTTNKQQDKQGESSSEMVEEKDEKKHEQKVKESNETGNMKIPGITDQRHIIQKLKEEVVIPEEKPSLQKEEKQIAQSPQLVLQNSQKQPQADQKLEVQGQQQSKP